MTRLLSAGFLAIMFLACGRGSDSEVEKQTPSPSGAQTATKPPTTACSLDKHKAIREVHFAQRAMTLMAKPTYPAEALENGDEGVVNVDMIIDRDGNVVEACPLSGPSSLRSAAQKAALACKFKSNFGLDEPARNQYRRDLITYLFVPSASRQVDETHHIVVRPKNQKTGSR